MPTEHAKYMSLALRLAKKAEGFTSPNPLVGAVVVKGGEIIGKGYHKKAGFPHAEIEAFNDATKNKKSLEGASLFVTLEPCCHEDKKTPPCVNAIAENGISAVYVAVLDPNPKVNGGGVDVLRKKGIKVEVGMLEEKAKEVNEAFFKYISTGTPFVTLKLAATMDGKIASYTGDSKWIGSEVQRRYAHKLRARSDAVMVGINTVLNDNPRLDVRLKKGISRHPVPVVLDSKLRIPPESNLILIHERSIIATTKSRDLRKKEKLEKSGAKILTERTNKDGLINLRGLMKSLGKLGIMNLLIEGGSQVAAQALKSQIVNKVTIFYAPRILGREGINMIGELGIKSVKNSLGLENVKIKRIGEEFMVEADVKKI